MRKPSVFALLRDGRVRLRSTLMRIAGRRMRSGMRAFMKASSFYDLPVTECEPESTKVLVLAPHMDDEVLGCGGTIARHVSVGADVTVIFLTDGRRGVVPRAAGEGEAPRGDDEIVGIRKDEARRAGAILGVRRIDFLDAEDSYLRADVHVTGRLRRILEEDRPEIVYLPFFLEGHPDHRAANDVLMAAVKGAAWRFECRAYEVWTPLFPNRLVKIDATMHLKTEALACYQSQLAVTDYLHSGVGLNAFRALGLGSHAGRFAEAFYSLPLAEYRRLYHAIRPVT